MMILKTPLYGHAPSRQSPMGNNHDVFLFLALQEFFSKEVRYARVALRCCQVKTKRILY